MRHKNERSSVLKKYHFSTRFVVLLGKRKLPIKIGWLVRTIAHSGVTTSSKKLHTISHVPRDNKCSTNWPVRLRSQITAYQVLLCYQIVIYPNDILTNGSFVYHRQLLKLLSHQNEKLSQLLISHSVIVLIADFSSSSGGIRNTG